AESASSSGLPAMPAGGPANPPFDPVPPAFRVGFRGYDTREVDRWARYMQAQVEAARVAHDELTREMRRLAEQLDRANEEIAELRRRPTVDDTIAFRHLGPRVEQILEHAHAEAE